MPRFVLPSDRSVLGLKQNFPNAGAALVCAHNASMNVGLADFAFIFDFVKTREHANGWYFAMKRVHPTAGYVVFTLLTDVPALYMYDGLGGGLTFAATSALSFGRHILSIFADRDGNAEFYQDATLIGSPSIVEGNVNQDNTEVFYGNYNHLVQEYQLFNDALLSMQFYNFGVGGIPTLAERQRIVAEMQVNPFSVPMALSSRPNYATEKRLHLNFENLDPSWNYVPDISAYGNNMSLGGGAAVCEAVKEFMQV